MNTKDLKIGDTLIAVNECKMYVSGQIALVVGKEYQIKEVFSHVPCISVESEIDSNHYFEFKEVSKYFKLKQ